MPYSTNVGDIVVTATPSSTTGRSDTPKTQQGTSAFTIVAPEDTRAESDALPGAVRANWGKIAKAKLTQRMYAKIVRVAAASAALRPPARALTPASLGVFLDFWMRVRFVAAEPELALAADGIVSAEWYKSPRQKLDLRFAASTVIYGLFANSSISEGADSSETVANLLKAHPSKPLQWSAL
jgi:hypothetical protein